MRLKCVQNEFLLIFM